MIEFNYNTFCISRNVIKEMLHDRGYKLNETVKTKKDYEKALEECKIEEKATKKEINILVIWYPHIDDEIKITIQEISNLSSRLENEEYDKILIITDVVVTPKASKTIEVDKDIFELRSFEETQYNVTKHVLVPKHRRLSKQEKNEVLSMYNTTADKISKLKRSDPICRWYQFKSKSLIEITREGTNGPEISYRIVK